MNPPDLGVKVNDEANIKDSMGGAVQLESNRDVLKQWVQHAFDSPLRVIVLNYINRVHPNADMRIAGELVDEFIKNKRN